MPINAAAHHCPHHRHDLHQQRGRDPPAPHPRPTDPTDATQQLRIRRSMAPHTIAGTANMHDPHQHSRRDPPATIDTPQSTMGTTVVIGRAHGCNPAAQQMQLTSTARHHWHHTPNPLAPWMQFSRTTNADHRCNTSPPTPQTRAESRAHATQWHHPCVSPAPQDIATAPTL